MNLSSLELVWAPRMLSLLRIMTGLVFLQHGTQKLLGFPSAGNPLPPMMSLFWFQGVIELVGGVLIVLGLFTRPTAFFLAGNMAVAYFMAHASKGFFPILNGGDAAILDCFIFLYLMVAGAGVWSLDHMRRQSL